MHATTVSVRATLGPQGHCGLYASSLKIQFFCLKGKIPSSTDYSPSLSYNQLWHCSQLLKKIVVPPPPPFLVVYGPSQWFWLHHLPCQVDWFQCAGRHKGGHSRWLLYPTSPSSYQQDGKLRQQFSHTGRDTVTVGEGQVSHFILYFWFQHAHTPHPIFSPPPPTTFCWCEGKK